MARHGRQMLPRTSPALSLSVLFCSVTMATTLHDHLTHSLTDTGSFITDRGKKKGEKGLLCLGVSLE